MGGCGWKEGDWWQGSDQYIHGANKDGDRGDVMWVVYERMIWDRRRYVGSVCANHTSWMVDFGKGKQLMRTIVTSEEKYLC